MSNDMNRMGEVGVRKSSAQVQKKQTESQKLIMAVEDINSQIDITNVASVES